MKIRRLKIKDSKYMYEWMQDKEITGYMYTDFNSKTLNDVKLFIKNSITKKNINLAIVSDTDEYMGTVSIKKTSKINRKAFKDISLYILSNAGKEFSAENIAKYYTKKCRTWNYNS